MPTYVGTWNGASPGYSAGWFGATTPVDPDQLLVLPALGEGSATATLGALVPLALNAALGEGSATVELYSTSTVVAVSASLTWEVGTATVSTTEATPRRRKKSRGKGWVLPVLDRVDREAMAQKAKLEAQTQQAAASMAADLLPECNFSAAALGAQMLPGGSDDADAAALLLIGLLRDMSKI